MNTNCEAVGVVMLGGLSSRMGSDKAELIINGQTLAQRATDTLERSGLKQVVISSGSKPYGINDQISGKGPLAGLYAVMKHASSKDASGFVFLPVDMPLITTALIKLLVDSGSANGLACQFKSWPLPCYLPNQVKILQALEQALDENVLAVKGLLNKLKAIELETDEVNQQVFTNINTPEQWLRYKQLIS